MGEKKTVEALINGGEATAGPPLGPALGPLGVNVLQIVNAINELTKAYAGMKVPVKVIVDIDTKAFDVEIGTPTTSALIIKELGIEKGSGNPKAEKVGDIPLEKAVKIAKIKLEDTYSKDLKAALKEVLGTFISMGVTVNNKDPREVQREIDRGDYEELIKQADK
ncbi:MAG: 50S ribosomal protein L11 [Candidatus Bathyarchaeia archaeon]